MSADELHRASRMVAAIEADEDPGSRALANTLRRCALSSLLLRAQREGWSAEIRLGLIRKLEDLPEVT